jgi:hypothetical protein
MEFIKKELKENGYDYVILVMFVMFCFAIYEGWL